MHRRRVFIQQRDSLDTNTIFSSIRVMSSEAVNKNSREEEKERLPPPECYQVDALYYDSYEEEGEEDEEGPYKTREQKLQRLEELDNKACCPRRLDEVYPNTEMTTPEQLEEQIKRFEELKNQTEYKEYCDSENTSNDTKKQEEGKKDGPEN